MLTFAATDVVPVAGIILGVFGVISLVVASVVVAFGSRARTLAVQQDQSINSLQGELVSANSRIDGVVAENLQLRSQLAEAKGAIDALQRSPHEALAALDRKMEIGFTALGVDGERLRLVR